MKTNTLALFLFILGSSFLAVSQNQIDLMILNKEYSTALTEIEKQLEVSPSAELFSKQGLVYNSLQNYVSAVHAYLNAVQYAPENAGLLIEVADNMVILGNQHDAVEYYSKAVALEPENANYASKLGKLLINHKKHKEAYNIFANIYLNDSSNIYWNKQLAYCSFRIGKRTQAVYLYEKVLKENPRDHGTYINLIHTYSRKKEAEKIYNTIEAGLKEFPNDSELLLERADFFFKTKKYAPAMKAFETYFAAEGDSIYEIIMDYGISTYFSETEGSKEKALDTFNKLFLANPNDAFVHFYLSLCNKKLGNFEEAEKFMNWAIDFSMPDYLPEFYHHLGQIYGLQRKFDESIEALKKSNELDPNNSEVLFEIATTYEEFHSNKTLALNYYQIYLKEAGEAGRNINYALDRITKIKEDLFFEE